MKLLLTLLLVLTAQVCQAQMNGLNPSILYIETPEHTWSGTAFQLATRKGPIVVTNKHVCGKKTAMMVRIPGVMVRKLLVVKKVSDKYDLCILSSVNNVPSLQLAESYSFFEAVSVDGFPRGKRTFSVGMVGPAYVEADGVVLKSMMVEYSGNVDFGSSGSPVVDKFGYVIGVIAVKFEYGNGGAFVPLEFVKDFLQDTNYLD